jgi:urease subunit gamma/beta
MSITGLTPGERDHLLLFTTALLAAQRRERGLLLNIPEATALIAHAVCEWARDGLDLSSARERARHLLGADEVLPEVLDLLTEIRVEARFDDGTRLVVVSDPFRISQPSEDYPSDDIDTPTRQAIITVTNCADVPIGITSHIHLAEINPRVRLDRAAVFGMRLAIPTGDTLWLEPGATVSVGVTPIGGSRVLIGNSGVVDGPLDNPEVRQRALTRLRECGYLDIVEGQHVGDMETAEQAVTRLMVDRAKT